MFDYPLWVSRETHYTLLGIPPEATADEIREAINERKQDLAAQVVEIARQVKEVYDKVPDLKKAEEEVRTLRAQRDEGKPVDGAAMAAAQKRLDEAEAKARRVNAEFRALQRKQAELEATASGLNNLGLQNTEQRQAYKRAHPPLDLLELTDCASEPFADPADTRTPLVQLRRELARFLASLGEEVYHPSDLTREDFTADFTYNELLDGRTTTAP
jgi:DNA repair exonuclease SbcCD ATPase subunit